MWIPSSGIKLYDSLLRTASNNNKSLRLKSLKSGFEFQLELPNDHLKQKIFKSRNKIHRHWNTR